MNSMAEGLMRIGSWVVALTVVLSSGAQPVWAEVCPARSTASADIVVAIETAPGCDRAEKIFESCQFGAGGDVELGAAVEKKCEADFFGQLTPPQKSAYRREIGVCDRKYQNQSGTMYVSFTAFCRARVAQRYAQSRRKSGNPIRDR